MKNQTSKSKTLSHCYDDRIVTNQKIDKGALKNLIAKLTLGQNGPQSVAERLDRLKSLGFHHATQFGTSLSIEDLWMPYAKEWLIQDAESEEKDSENSLERAGMDGVERLRALIDTWSRTGESLKKEMVLTFQSLDPFNPIFMMAFSGARGNWSQVHQLLGMRGLMSDPQGQIIDLPIRSNFREGLSLTEYIISCYGARKGVVDTAVRTATSGYLTRRLVDVAQHVIVRSSDCHTSQGFWTQALREAKQRRTSSNSFRRTYLLLEQRLVGRVLAQDIRFDSKFFAGCGDDIANNLADILSFLFPQKLKLRSPFTCAQARFICQCCYGWNLAQGNLVTIGEAVGIVAAQSIGEPGTQLTMRTFHTGGVFSGEVAEQVRAPFNGFVHFDLNRARRIRQFGTGEKRQAWFIQEPLEIIVLGTQALALQVPSFTLIFFQPGDAVLSRQVIAEIRSSLLTFPETANKVIYSDLNGQIFLQKAGRLEAVHSHLPVEKQKSYSRLPREQMVSLRQEVRAWVMSGQKLRFHNQHQVVEGYRFYDIVQNGTILQAKILSFYKPRGTLFFEFVNDISALRCSHAVFPNDFHSLTQWSSVCFFPKGLKKKLLPNRERGLFFSFLLDRTKKNIGFTRSDSSFFGLSSFKTRKRLGPWPPDLARTRSQMREVLHLGPASLASSLHCCPIFVRNPRFYHGHIFISRTSFASSTGILLEKIRVSSQYSAQLLLHDKDFVRLYPWNIETDRLSPWAHGNLVQTLDGVNIWFPRKTLGLIREQRLKNSESFFFIANARDWHLYNNWNIYFSNPTCVPSIGFEFLYAQLGAWILPRDLPPYDYKKAKAFAGYITKTYANHLILRQGIPYLANRGTVLFQGPGSPVCQGEPLIGLVYTRPKTADIVQGLPKVERLLEARISHPLVHYAKELFYKLFQAKYQRCFQKTKNLKPLLYTEANIEKAQTILLDAVQEVYQSQKVGISDRHLELVIRQMTSLVIINGNREIRNQPGDIARHRQISSYSKILSNPVPTQPMILGITRAALTTESFLSEAGFQETSRVLARSASRGRVDWLRGIKGRVMIGELIPAGTSVWSPSPLFLFPITLQDSKALWYHSNESVFSLKDSILNIILSIQEPISEA
uniref:RNA polymerase beta'' subunit n=1 Tax=Klebsormidium mucosum TaxID=442831 RepID=UPI00286C9498|nr:RNA polymerase beta'' subunit [Klebsormidium mucosum]WKT07101.1 RNA polymerase beta'' subunit [Klebsormidium mucosum]